MNSQGLEGDHCILHLLLHMKTASSPSSPSMGLFLDELYGSNESARRPDSPQLLKKEERSRGTTNEMPY
jgi:hypothetical protein